MRILHASLLLCACASTDGLDGVDDTAPSVTLTGTRIFDRLGDDAGPVAGLPGFFVVHVPDPSRCGAVAVSVQRSPRSVVAAGDQPLVDVLTLAFPTDLDFSDDNRARVSKKRFDAFLADMTSRSQRALTAYKADASAAPDIKTKLIAAARNVQISRHFASTLVRAAIPADVRRSQMVDGRDLAPEKIDAYCDALATAAEPLLERAIEAAQRCAELALDADPGWWTDVCTN